MRLTHLVSNEVLRRQPAYAASEVVRRTRRVLRCGEEHPDRLEHDHHVHVQEQDAVRTWG